MVHPKYKYIHTYMSDRSNPASWHQPNHWGRRSQEIVSVSHDNSKQCRIVLVLSLAPITPGYKMVLKAIYNSNLEASALWLIEKLAEYGGTPYAWH